MNEENFIVKFVPLKHCFLQFSSKWFYKINNPKYTCLRLTNPASKRTLYFSWAPQPAYAALNDCSVGINATFAQALGLQEGELVVISSMENVTSLHRVYLTPATADDYEILELSSDDIEVSLLNQIRIVFVNQLIVVWLSKTMHLKLTVDCLEPNLTHGRLEDLSELVIKNVSRSIESEMISNKNSRPSGMSDNDNQSSDNPKKKSFYWSLIEDYLPDSVFSILADDGRNLQQENEINKPDLAEMVCRVHPTPTSPNLNCCQGVHDQLVHPFNVFVSKCTLKRQLELMKNSFPSSMLSEQHDVVLCRLSIISKKRAKPKKTTENSKEGLSGENEARSVCVRLCRINDTCTVFSREETNISCIFVSKFLRKVLELDFGMSVRLREYRPPLNKTLSAITLVPSKKLDDEEAQTLIDQFKERVSRRDGVLVNDCCPFPVPRSHCPDFAVLTVLLPGELDCWPLTHTELQVASVTVASEAEKSLESLRGYDKEEECHTLKSSVFEDLQNQGIAVIEHGLELIGTQLQTSPASILITGKQGSGKSRLAEALYSAVSGQPHYVFVTVLDCKPLKGKKPESVAKILIESLEKCLVRQPAALVLEDLHCIASAPANDSEPTQENLYFLRVATVVKQLLWWVRRARVAVVATADTRTRVHPQLVAARGRHAFTTFLRIPPLTRADRLRIIQELVGERLAEAVLPDLNAVAAQTEGCVARDLHRLVDRMVFRACQRQEGGRVEVTAGDVAAALEGFTPSELMSVSLSRQTALTFADVGGLHDAKRQLTELLIWPNKYPEVFSQCPLRLERGVLLYGAPGAGKTLLATAAAGESRLNLITVKGPELLSKYIGASEEAVRNVFEKAQSARPCILFFDEFDSLAPRRGHDSTGVTDRVVNQLLTQMDGVEALEGVWVVAAASRPDLLDPALLRPGRIGYLLHCPPPDQEERLEILKTLSTKLRLSEDVSLREIASRTDEYTGADLQAILFTAQMVAYDAVHQDSDDEVKTPSSSPNDVVVSQDHLLAALQDTPPSLKPEDRSRFQQMYLMEDVTLNMNKGYERFQKLKQPGQSSAEEQNLRVTLA